MRKRQKKRKKSLQRDDSYISRWNRLLTKKKKYDKVSYKQSDLRNFRPEQERRKRLDEFGRPSRIKLSDPKKRRNRYDPTTARIQFANPEKIMVCKRRADRRAALFMFNKIGKGSGGNKFKKKRRLTEDSKIKC